VYKWDIYFVFFYECFIGETSLRFSETLWPRKSVPAGDASLTSAGDNSHADSRMACRSIFRTSHHPSNHP
jgi:hypothetical protein